MLPDQKCTGCGACMQACAFNCITMQPNSQGFLYPAIDASRCVSCGACERACPANAAEGKNPLPLKVLAARVNDPEILSKSSSGGIAWLLADACLRNGGVIYGAAFDDAMTLRHIRVTDEAGLTRLQGSKYVQSDIQEIYPLLREDLTSGRNVLFFGTPCQAAGIKKTFGMRENLTLCDLICHGVPSPKLFADHIRCIEASGKKVSDYRFRDKTLGWSYQLHRIFYRDGSSELHSYWNQCYKRLYMLGLMERESCYHCPYKDVRRVGDVTLGDYWGNSRVSEQFSDDRGVNVVFFNTEKVISQFYPILQDRAVFIETEIEDALQKHLIMPCAKTEKVAAFWNCYETTTYRNAAEKFAGNYRYLILRNGIKDFLRAHGALEHLRKGRRE